MKCQGAVRVAWEGDFEALHSLAIVNRAVCRGLIDRGHEVKIIDSRADAAVEREGRIELDARLAQARLAVVSGAVGSGAASGFEAQVHVRHHWPPSDRAAGTRTMGADAALGIRQLAQGVDSHAQASRRGLGL